MAEPFLGEIRMMSFNYAPKGWAQCNGQFLPINQNQALFSLLGTMYGGNGQTTFGLPDLRGSTPLHKGGSFPTQGQKGGETAHTLTIPEMPMHPHVAQASTQVGSTQFALNNILSAAGNLYTTPSNLTAISPTSISNTGGSQAHQNMQPFLTVNFCIALIGIFPSQN